MKRKILFALLIASVGLLMASCEKEEVYESGDVQEALETSCSALAHNDPLFVLQIEDTTKYKPVLSKSFYAKYSKVFIGNDGGTSTEYKTIKVRNTTNTIMQEWMFVDLRTDLIADYVTQPNDNSGANHGFYYTWEGNVSSFSQSDWNGIIKNAQGNAELGFHIPNDSEIDDFSTVIGGSNLIPQYLNLKWDGTYFPALGTFQTTSCAFWQNPIDMNRWPNYNGADPNKRQGCGILSVWYGNGSNRLASYTNIPNLYVKVRLMRYITPSQW